MKDAGVIAGISLTDSEGNEVLVGDLWRESPAVVAWLRHYG